MVVAQSEAGPQIYTGKLSRSSTNSIAAMYGNGNGSESKNPFDGLDNFANEFDWTQFDPLVPSSSLPGLSTSDLSSTPAKAPSKWSGPEQDMVDLLDVVPYMSSADRRAIPPPPVSVSSYFSGGGQLGNPQARGPWSAIGISQ